MKQGDILAPLIFILLWNVLLESNDTHQVLTYADDVNLIGEDIRTIERNADVLLNSCKDIRQPYCKGDV